MTDTRKFFCPSCGKEVEVSPHAWTYECPHADCMAEDYTPWADDDESPADLVEMFK